MVMPHRQITGDRLGKSAEVLPHALANGLQGLETSGLCMTPEAQSFASRSRKQWPSTLDSARSWSNSTSNDATTRLSRTSPDLAVAGCGKSALQGFEVDDQIADLLQVQFKLGHRPVCGPDPLRECLDEIFDGIPLM